MEFWPETGKGSRKTWQRSNDRKFYYRLFGRRQVNLRLLRTCKRVNGEAAQIFYGENEFRFSGINGCIVASAFVHTIAPHHPQWVTQLTIAMPLLSHNRSIYASEGNHGTDLGIFDVVDGPWALLRYPANRRKWWSHNGSFCLLVQKIVRASKLKKLTLLLPHYFNLYYNEDSNLQAWSAFKSLVAAKPDVFVQVVSLWQPSEDEGSVPGHHAKVLMRLRAITNVVHIGTEYDGHGRWPVAEDAQRVVLEDAEEASNTINAW